MRFARFIDGPSGTLFCTGYEHPEPVDGARAVIVIPPFAEELNKSRHVLSAIVRAIGSNGREVVLADLHGTGDSAGEFSEASVDGWRRDIDRIVEVFGRGRAVDLVALRFGALLAADAVARHPVEQLALLHPVADGKQQLTQMLRLRLAAGMTAGRGEESMADLKAMLANGDGVETGGYRLSSEMAAQLPALKLADIRLERVRRLAWFEIAAAADRPLMPVSQRLVDGWQSDCDVTAEALVGDQFWMTQEIAACDVLAERASEWMLQA
ncbi:MAG: hydrolase 2, exosortase A system-associated [Gammaproteobacteria bacterium]|nr:hydrolase 2, exosortase A system-associated [Gammaproteobacteria bacterium]